MHCITGIGININQTSLPENITNFTSLKIITGKSFSTKKCLFELLNCIYARYQLLKNQDNIIDMDYLNNLYLRDLKRQYIINGQLTEATIIGVNEYGMLLLATKSKKVISCDLKEIQFI